MNPERRIGLQMATDEEAKHAAAANFLDLWLSLPLRAPASWTLRAAKQLWGPPEFGDGGELTWRMRTDDEDGHPVRLRTDYTTSCILFSAFDHPERADAEELARRMDGVLREIGHPRCGRPVARDASD